jgi:hypothetical protein
VALGFSRVEGELLGPSGATVSRSVVTHHLDVRPKNCGGTINSPPTTSGFPGLTGGSINLGNADVLGDVNGNILCTACAGINIAQEINKLPGSTVNGNLFSGALPLPPIPEPPPGLPAPSASMDITSSTTISSGSDNNGRCIVVAPVTSCRINNIDLQGGNASLTFNTSPGEQIRVYLSGSIQLSGQQRIIHGGTSSQLSIFGNPADSDNSNDQSITLNGGANAINAFIYLPDGNVGVNGGSSTPDFRGAIWAKSFGVGTSNSNRIDIRIPDDMGRQLQDTLGDSFNVSIRDFTAAGTSFWSSHVSQ